MVAAFVGCSSQTCSETGPEIQTETQIETRAATKTNQPMPNQQRRKRGMQNRAQGKPPGVQLAAMHILVSYNGAVRAEPTITRSREEAKARALMIYKKLADGAEFTEVAKEYSDGPYRNKGGNLGTFPSTRVPPPIAQGLQTLRIGQLTEPLESRFGFHIVRREEISSNSPQNSN
jgi:parvulin-like peptidyl-prolyl isomerase